MTPPAHLGSWLAWATEGILSSAALPRTAVASHPAPSCADEPAHENRLGIFLVETDFTKAAYDAALAGDARLRRECDAALQSMQFEPRDWASCIFMAKAGTWSANVRIPHTGLSTRDAYRVLLEEWGARQRGSLFSRSNNIAIRLLYFSSPLYEDRADLEPLAARAPPGDTSAPFSAVGAAVCARVEARMERAKRLRIKTRRERV